MPASVTPVATYRLQLHKGFTFWDAGRIADYLNQLGVSHVYSSPYLQAAPGSQHGYDVVDHSRVNAELGGPEGHESFCASLGRHKLGQVLDIVPNHMAITGRENRWWWDVLENGPASPYASYFDVEWRPPEQKLRNKVLMPILGDHYGRVLGQGQITLERDGGRFNIRYFDHVLPAAPRSLGELLSDAAKRSGSDYLGFLADSLSRLPRATTTDRERLVARNRDKEVIYESLRRLCAEHPDIADTLDECVSRLNSDIDRLDQLLERQNYRIAFWKTAGRELGHRRFFDVNTLVGLRTESEEVFSETHRLLMNWIGQGVIDGLRVDHPDGLRDPEQYFQRLAAAAPRAWIVAEKILEPGETLRGSWPIAGTTGYDFLNVVNRLFVDPMGERTMTDGYASFTGEGRSYEQVAFEKKHLVVREVLGSDVNRLTAVFVDICERNRDQRDYTRHDVHHAVREAAACFPVYRTYVRAEAGEISDRDIAYIDEAIEAAKKNRPDLDPELFDFLSRILRLESRGNLETEFVMRFQQFTGPVMAKGVEDTAFYCYNRLVSLNEVGGNPGLFGGDTREFHDFCAHLQVNHPRTMTASSTHDTKRSEDVRARLNLLSEIPEIWNAAVRRWHTANQRFLTGELPDRNTEYLLYQTLFGAWPIGADRLKSYMLKATREGKQQTSWIDPNPSFERGLDTFIDGILGDEPFLTDFQKFVAPLVEPGRANSLSQTLIKLTAPGIPDIYQGMELWDLSLVDPDNRRPVDYELRRRLLLELDHLDVEKIRSRSDEGLPKLWVTRQALALRRERPATFGGSYRALATTGAKSLHVIAFQRGDDVITIATRWPLRLADDWAEISIALPEGRWRNRLTREPAAGEVRLAELLAKFPAALLSLEGSG